MSESIHRPEPVLVYHTHLHRASWMSPAAAWLLVDADPRVEIIEEQDKFFDAYAELAGPKPR